MLGLSLMFRELSPPSHQHRAATNYIPVFVKGELGASPWQLIMQGKQSSYTRAALCWRNQTALPRLLYVQREPSGSPLAAICAGRAKWLSPGCYMCRESQVALPWLLYVQREPSGSPLAAICAGRAKWLSPGCYMCRESQVALPWLLYVQREPSGSPLAAICAVRASPGCYMCGESQVALPWLLYVQ